MVNRLKYISILIFFIISAIISPLSVCADETEYKTTITYTVKKGDTLWGLSQKFFDSPWYWPGLWAENTDIPNPHWIYPGQKITLYNKNEISKIQKQEQKPVSDVIKIIQKQKQKNVAQKKPAFVFRKINKLPFIAKTPIKPDGTIKKGVSPVEMYSTADEIYILAHEDANKFLIGEKYAIYKKPIKIKDPNNQRKLIGYQYNLAGIIEILKKEGNLLRAVITNAYRPINQDDLITEFHEISPDIFLNPSVPGLKGQIIKEKEGAMYLGENFVGFIDAGMDKGVKRGQIYSIVEKQSIKLNRKNDISEYIPYGSFVVLEAKETTAAILILEAEKQINEGALFISPVM